MILQVCKISKEFEGLKAVSEASFSIEPGSITGLIGPNGAGKTTMFNIITGNVQPTSGKIILDGHEITGKKPHKTFHLGIVRTFQIPKPFSQMTVLENLMMVPSGQLGEKLWNNWLRHDAVMEQETVLKDRAENILEFLKLDSLKNESASNLSGGQLKLLELGRALISEPKIILLDEPAAGVNPILLEEIVERIWEINRMGITFLIIEHNMEMVMKLCSPIMVMAEGAILMQGEADEIRSDKRLLEAFFGE